MHFSFHVESIRTAALSLDYYFVPWDSEILGVPVAQIEALQVEDAVQAVRDYETFSHWCTQQRIELCSCRLPADRLRESMFLEQHDYRFVELNYLPRLTGLQRLELPEDSIQVDLAGDHDRDTLAGMAARVFRHGRFHQDPRIDPALGDHRYRIWMQNAFTHPRQQVLKCVLEGVIVGFFVVEFREPRQCHWSLIGLAPGMQGRSLGKRVWKAVLQKHRNDGVDTVTTSISSHNVPVFNLYVSLGFRFPQPLITLQWRPKDSGILPM